MQILRAADLRAALDCVGALAEAGADTERFALAGVDALPRLVSSEITTLSVCNLESGRRHVIASPGSRLGAPEREAFDRHFHAHPLVRYHGVERGRGAHRISDSVPFGRFRESGLYSEYYRRIGIDHAVAMPMAVGEGVLVSFVLNRRRRDFGDRELALLDLVGGHLARQYRRLVVAGGAEKERVALRRLVERTAATDPGVRRDAGLRLGIPLGAWGVLAALTPREREVVRWLAAGKTDRDIAALLGCSHRTVQKHLERVYAKLGVETRTAAVMRALGVRVR
jgi:DNA-binding CsgD family transcriptional regulator